ncbi:BofC C-terminal domain-containing protein [Paenibacillus hexagrammi]|uniref:BofC C-terminal domain-containing protein n=1 Tax=Paenibacillus hexagrammi TaxID=2908839 RepID=A0ABY3SFM8_9BACL|nr:BofC C-terminal domain-containing protein [Paenibacillus sp. YPD9-1]UJF31981.1 BofC C-terminal domain-containing protein [Paenibacillus sp. YPD9-1]
MNVQRFFKHLKKKLRWKRNWLALGMFVFVCGAGYLLVASGFEGQQRDKPGILARMTMGSVKPEEDLKWQKSIAAIKGITDSRDTYLLKSYVCGEERQALGHLTSEQMLSEFTKHPDWTLDINAQGEVTFTEQVEDLSPNCKENAVFSLDESGNLSLFQGTPSKENVIRTFFQLNIQHLESSLPSETVKQLREGIRISDMEEYNSVISTFSDYAVEESAGAMSHPVEK